jgi:serine phosphatase RsbU (regulator of sigma subunit)/tetratricopeptide (TPR) repeat protein
MLKHTSILLFCLLLFNTAFGQSETDALNTRLSKATKAAEKVEILTELSKIELKNGRIAEAEKKAEQALVLSENNPPTSLLTQLASLYQKKEQFATALNYYLQVIKVYEDEKNQVKLAETNEQIGLLYKTWGVNEKAVEYLTPAYETYKEMDNQTSEIRVLAELIVTYQTLGKTEEALAYNQSLLAIHQSNKKTKQIINALSNISNLHLQLNKPEESLKNQLEILELDKSLKDSAGISSALNNLGFLYKKLKQYDKALAHFQESMAYAQDRNPVTLVNIGVMQQVKGNVDASLLVFFEAAKIREQQKNDKEVAKVCNYISALYQGQEDTESALRYAERAIQFGTKAESKETLATSYKAFSEIYQSMWRNKKALEYYKLYAETTDAIQAGDQEKLQNELQKRANAEKKENDLKLLLVDKEVNQLSLTKLQLETEKKEKELQLQLQEQELANASLKQQELEKEGYLQQIILEKNKIEADKKSREVVMLQATDRLQRLALKQKELEEKERTKDIALLTKENQIKDLLNKEQLAKQETERKYFFYGLGFVLLIILLLLIGFILKQRANRKLEAQKKEIAVKNEELNGKNTLLNTQNNTLQLQKDEIMVQTEELSQQRDEILAQRDYIEDKNSELEKQHNTIEKAFHDISVLSEIGQEITATLNLSAIINTVYKNVNELMDATCFGIGIFNHEKEVLEFTDFIEKGEILPYSVDAINNEKLPSVKCFLNSEDIFINSLEEVHNAFSIPVEESRGELPSSLIYLPLMVESRRIGVLTVQSFKENAYTESDLTLLHTLGSYASIALDNSRAYEQVQYANEVIGEKNKQITDSLRYALTIEEAILPSEKWFQESFQDYFIFFKPKDIVSGDFYWAHEQDGYKIVIAVDCTGHGVPGAFMSMIGNSLLNQAIKENKMDSPADILTFLNEKIKEHFKQDSTETSEGMDVCVCKMEEHDNKHVKVTFSGAKRPLYYLQPENTEMETLKADRISIGWPYKTTRKNLFHDQEILLPKGTSIYLTTDGYADNHGLEKSKIGSPKLRNTLTKNSNKPMQDQKQVLADLLLHEQGTKEQRDDITVIGLKL